MDYYNNSRGFAEEVSWNMGSDNIKSNKFATQNEATALGSTETLGGGFRILLAMFFFKLNIIYILASST